MEVLGDGSYLSSASFGSGLVPADFFTRLDLFPQSGRVMSGMLRICSLAGETLLALTAEEYEGQTVKSLKTLVAKQIGVPRFRQRWLGEDHTELKDDALVSVSDVQIVILDFVQAENGDVQKLFDACEKNLLDQVDELLCKPLDPNVLHLDEVDAEDETALVVAAKFGHVDCIALLLEAGAAKTAATDDGTTALHFAALVGRLEVVQMLLEVGFDKDATNHRGSTPLLFAATSGHLEVVRLLLESGAATDVSDGGTALHWAARNGHLEVVKLLLEASALDADVHSSDSGMTPLHFATINGHLEVVVLLLEAGANRSARDQDVALQLAAEYRETKISELLEHHRRLAEIR